MKQLKAEVKRQMALRGDYKVTANIINIIKIKLREYTLLGNDCLLVVQKYSSRKKTILPQQDVRKFFSLVVGT